MHRHKGLAIPLFFMRFGELGSNVGSKVKLTKLEGASSLFSWMGSTFFTWHWGATRLFGSLGTTSGPASVAACLF